MKLHVSKQVPLFISALTEPHTQIESTVTAFPHLLFLFFFFFWKTDKKKNQINSSANRQLSAAASRSHGLKELNIFFLLLHNDFVLIFFFFLHHTKCFVLKPPASIKNISIGCIYFHGTCSQRTCLVRGGGGGRSTRATVTGPMVKSSGTFFLPSCGDECLVDDRKIK